MFGLRLGKHPRTVIATDVEFARIGTIKPSEQGAAGAAARLNGLHESRVIGAE